MFCTGTTYLEGITVAEFHGELDYCEAPVATEAISALLSWDPRIIIDLAKLEFMDCAGLRVLVQASRACEAAGGWLILSRPQGSVRRLLEVLQVWKDFTIWEPASPCRHHSGLPCVVPCLSAECEVGACVPSGIYRAHLV